MLLVVHENADFSGVSFQSCFRIQRLLARQWIQEWRQFMRLWYFTHVLRGCELGSSLCPSTSTFADEEVAALVVDNGGMDGVAGFDAPRAVPSTVACARRFLHVMLCSLSWRQAQAFYFHKPVAIPQVQLLDKGDTPVVE